MHVMPIWPTYLTLAPRFFRDLADRITAGNFGPANQLADTIIACLAERNREHKCYR